MKYNNSLKTSTIKINNFDFNSEFIQFSVIPEQIHVVQERKFQARRDLSELERSLLVSMAHLDCKPDWLPGPQRGRSILIQIFTKFR